MWKRFPFFAKRGARREMTDSELLTSIESSIEKILGTGQYVSINEYKVAYPQLSTLLAERRRLLRAAGLSSTLDVRTLAMIGEL